MTAGASVAALMLAVATPAAGQQAADQAEQSEAAEEAGFSFDALLGDVLAMVGMGADEEALAEEQALAEPEPEPEAEAVLPVIRAVELMTPGAEQTVLQRNFFGRVVARETANLAFPLNGTLTEFPVDEGVVVEEGALLAQLDLAPFERAVERAEIQLEQAERAYQRANQLADRGVGPATAAEDTRSARDLAEVALREARDALEDATITAPYRALIAERITANHVIVEPGLPIVRVHDISQMRVEIDVPERLVQRLPMSADVAFTAILPGSSEPTKLEIVEFEADTEAVGQSYTFTLSLPDLALPDGAATALLPGSSVTITAALPAPQPALVLPTTAIAADEQRQPYVMVFEPAGADEGIVRAVAVEVASVDGTSFSVTGLPSDVEIVETGAHLLRDGQDVRRFTGLRVEE
ncbi:MAG: efflux RND transporter periplasmic adaptor subunit [Devosiaceae bacterium]|nr:efflux RND transporter periplasmic adaptor subunit [Devosiaceae bacterium MH13]